MTDEKDTEVSEDRSGDLTRVAIETTVSPARRKLLRVLAGAGGMAVAGALLPEKWTQPLVNRVLVPAHAQATSIQPVLTTSIFAGAVNNNNEVAVNSQPACSGDVPGEAEFIRFILTVAPLPGAGDTASYFVSCSGSLSEGCGQGTAVFGTTKTGERGFETDRIERFELINGTASVTWTYAGETATCSANL